MTKERKQVLLTPITELIRALYTEDIPTIIHLLDKAKIDLRYSSDVINYVKELLIDDIKVHIESCTRNRTLRYDRGRDISIRQANGCRFIQYAQRRLFLFGRTIEICLQKSYRLL